MQMLFRHYPLCDLVQVCIWLVKPHDSALIALSSVFRHLVSEKVQLTSIKDKNLLEELKALIVRDYIKQEMRHSKADVAKASQTV